MTPEHRLAALGLTLPPAPAPLAVYVPLRRHRDMVWLAGQGPLRDGRPLRTGKFGAELRLEDGAELARLTALNALAALKAELGELSRIRAILHLNGYVASTPDFLLHHLVINGASELLAEVLGDAGHHARVAMGTNVLPMDIPLEISMVVAIDD